MLTIDIKSKELFNEESEGFVHVKSQRIHLEHSLLSVAKWEALYHKPFLDTLSKKEMTPEQFLDYIRCMTIEKDVERTQYFGLEQKDLDAINEYLNDSMTATWFAEEEDQKKGGGKQRTVTAELIYCWMIKLQMDVTVFQKWHFNRLITLIRTCNEENKAEVNDKPMDVNKRNAIMQKRRAEIAARKARQRKR